MAPQPPSAKNGTLQSDVDIPGERDRRYGPPSSNGSDDDDDDDGDDDCERRSSFRILSYMRLYVSMYVCLYVRV